MDYRVKHTNNLRGFLCRFKNTNTIHTMYPTNNLDTYSQQSTSFGCSQMWVAPEVLTFWLPAMTYDIPV